MHIENISQQQIKSDSHVENDSASYVRSADVAFIYLLLLSPV